MYKIFDDNIESGHKRTCDTENLEDRKKTKNSPLLSCNSMAINDFSNVTLESKNFNEDVTKWADYRHESAHRTLLKYLNKRRKKRKHKTKVTCNKYISQISDENPIPFLITNDLTVTQDNSTFGNKTDGILPNSLDNDSGTWCDFSDNVETGRSTALNNNSSSNLDKRMCLQPSNKSNATRNSVLDYKLNKSKLVQEKYCNKENNTGKPLNELLFTNELSNTAALGSQTRQQTNTECSEDFINLLNNFVPNNSTANIDKDLGTYYGLSENTEIENQKCTNSNQTSINIGKNSIEEERKECLRSQKLTRNLSGALEKLTLDDDKWLEFFSEDKLKKNKPPLQKDSKIKSFDTSNDRSLENCCVDKMKDNKLEQKKLCKSKTLLSDDDWLLEFCSEGNINTNKSYQNIIEKQVNIENRSPYKSLFTNDFDDELCNLEIERLEFNNHQTECSNTARQVNTTKSLNRHKSEGFQQSKFGEAVEKENTVHYTSINGISTNKTNLQELERSFSENKGSNNNSFLDFLRACNKIRPLDPKSQDIIKLPTQKLKNTITEKYMPHMKQKKSFIAHKSFKSNASIQMPTSLEEDTSQKFEFTFNMDANNIDKQSRKSLNSENHCSHFNYSSTPEPLKDANETAKIPKSDDLDLCQSTHKIKNFSLNNYLPHSKLDKVCFTNTSNINHVDKINNKNNLNKYSSQEFEFISDKFTKNDKLTDGEMPRYQNMKTSEHGTGTDNFWPHHEKCIWNKLNNDVNTDENISYKSQEFEFTSSGCINNKLADSNDPKLICRTSYDNNTGGTNSVSKNMEKLNDQNCLSEEFSFTSSECINNHLTDIKKSTDANIVISQHAIETNKSSSSCAPSNRSSRNFEAVDSGNFESLDNEEINTTNYLTGKFNHTAGGGKNKLFKTHETKNDNTDEYLSQNTELSTAGCTSSEELVLKSSKENKEQSSFQSQIINASINTLSKYNVFKNYNLKDQNTMEQLSEKTMVCEEELQSFNSELDFPKETKFIKTKLFESRFITNKKLNARHKLGNQNINNWTKETDFIHNGELADTEKSKEKDKDIKFPRNIIGKAKDKLGKLLHVKQNVRQCISYESEVTITGSVNFEDLINTFKIEKHSKVLVKNLVTRNDEMAADCSKVQDEHYEKPNLASESSFRSSDKNTKHQLFKKNMSNPEDVAFNKRAYIQKSKVRSSEDSGCTNHMFNNLQISKKLDGACIARGLTKVIEQSKTKLTPEIRATYLTKDFENVEQNTNECVPQEFQVTKNIKKTPKNVNQKKRKLSSQKTNSKWGHYDFTNRQNAKHKDCLSQECTNTEKLSNTQSTTKHSFQQTEDKYNIELTSKRRINDKPNNYLKQLSSNDEPTCNNNDKLETYQSNNFCTENNTAKEKYRSINTNCKGFFGVKDKNNIHSQPSNSNFLFAKPNHIRTSLSQPNNGTNLSRTNFPNQNITAKLQIPRTNFTEVFEIVEQTTNKCKPQEFQIAKHYEKPQKIENKNKRAFLSQEIDPNFPITNRQMTKYKDTRHCLSQECTNNRNLSNTQISNNLNTKKYFTQKFYDTNNVEYLSTSKKLNKLESNSKLEQFSSKKSVSSENTYNRNDNTFETFSNESKNAKVNYHNTKPNSNVNTYSNIYSQPSNNTCYLSAANSITKSLSQPTNGTNLLLQPDILIKPLLQKDSSSPYQRFDPSIYCDVTGNKLDIPEENQPTHLQLLNISRKPNQPVSIIKESQPVKRDKSLPKDINIDQKLDLASTIPEKNHSKHLQLVNISRKPDKCSNTNNDNVKSWQYQSESQRNSDGISILYETMLSQIHEDPTNTESDSAIDFIHLLNQDDVLFKDLLENTKIGEQVANIRMHTTKPSDNTSDLMNVDDEHYKDLFARCNTVRKTNKSDDILSYFKSPETMDTRNTYEITVSNANTRNEDHQSKPLDKTTSLKDAPTVFDSSETMRVESVNCTEKNDSYLTLLENDINMFNLENLAGNSILDNKYSQSRNTENEIQTENVSNPQSVCNTETASDSNNLFDNSQCFLDFINQYDGELTSSLIKLDTQQTSETKTTEKSILQSGRGTHITPFTSFTDTEIDTVSIWDMALETDDVFKNVNENSDKGNILNQSKTNHGNDETLSTGSKENFSLAEKRLRAGLNRISKDKKLLCVQEGTPTNTLPDCRKYIVQKKIAKIFRKILKDVQHKRSPILEIRNRHDWNNCLFVNNRLVLKPKGEASTAIINYRKNQSKSKFNLIIFILSKIRNLLSSNTTCTKRQIYYQIIRYVRKQSQVDTAINSISCLLNEPPWEFNILASSKGLVYGDLNIFNSANEVMNCNVAGGSLIPQDIRKITKLETTAYFVLIIEKDAIFQKLLDEDLPNRLTRPFIMITGKGFSDINTRLFVKKLWMSLSMPIFALVDADPFGIEIMLTYRFGSLSMSHLHEYLAVPSLRWIGVHPSEITALNISSQPLTTRDIAKANNILRRPYLESFPKLREELNILLKKNEKAEIEGLIHSTNFLRDFYLPNKFYTQDYF